MVEPKSDEILVAEITKAQRQMRAYLSKILANSPATDDVLQESNRVIWLKRQDWDPQTPFLKWAYRICFFQAKAHLRDRGRERLVFDEALLEMFAEEYPSERPAAMIEDALRQCLATFDQAKRSRLLRRYSGAGNETSLDHLAEELGVSPNTLAQQFRRMRQQLQTCIEARLTQLA